MSGLRPTPARKVLKVLEEMGFRPVSQRGSHVKLRRSDGRMIVVPLHGAKDIKVGLLRRLLREAGIDQEEFLRRL